MGEERFADALGRGLSDPSADPAFKALQLALPSESDLAVLSAPADPAAIHMAREALRTRIAAHLADPLRYLHGALQGTPATSPPAPRRPVAAPCATPPLAMLTTSGHQIDRDRAKGHFEAAANMTDAIGGLASLITLGGAEADDRRWRRSTPAGAMSPW